MRMYYFNEYGDEIVTKDGTIFPPVGSHIIIDEEDYYVSDVTWNIDDDSVLINVTENAAKKDAKAPDNNSARLSEMNRSIINIAKKQDLLEGKTKNLTAQLSTVRQHIKSQHTKDKNETR